MAATASQPADQRRRRDAVGAGQVRMAAPDEKEGACHQQVGDDGGQRACVDQPDQGRAAEERSDGADAGEQHDHRHRRAVPRVQAGEHRRQHAAAGHREQQPRRAEEERVPARQDAERTADDQDAARPRTPVDGAHRVGRGELAPVERGRVERQADRPLHERVPAERHQDRQHDDAPDGTQRDVDLLGELRDDVEPHVEERRHDDDPQHPPPSR